MCKLVFIGASTSRGTELLNFEQELTIMIYGN